MPEFRKTINQWIYLFQSQWWGLIIVYISIFLTTYLAIWAVIVLFSIPEQIVLHILISIFIAAHLSIFISLFIIRHTKDTLQLRNKVNQINLTHQLKNMYDVVSIYKNEIFDHFHLPAQENFAINISQDELRLFQKICSSTTTTIRASFIEYFQTRGIEIGDDITISVKLVISSDQLIERFEYLTDPIKKQILRKPLWVIAIYRDEHTYIHKRERDVGARIYDVESNTAFQLIFRDGKPFFLSNNLQDLHNYQNENPNWTEQYNSTLVVPIQYIQSGRQLTFGFLAVDSLNKNGSLLYDDTVSKYILSHSADLMATYFMSLLLPKPKPQEVVTNDMQRQKELNDVQPKSNIQKISKALPSAGEPLSTSITTSLIGSFLEEALKNGHEIRIQPITKTEEEKLGQDKIPILFLVADPTDTSRLRLGEELREIQEKLQLSKDRDRFALHQRMSVRPVDITQALLDIQPIIVHFSGHGISSGALCFEDQLGRSHPIQPDALAALFERFTERVNCVLLNACYSEVQANIIAKHIQYVIGMKQDIGDQAAIAFVIGFYQALGAGYPIEESYALGCVQIRLHNIPEYLTPVLIKKANADIYGEP